MGVDCVLGTTSYCNKPLTICVLWDFRVDNSNNGKQFLFFFLRQSTDGGRTFIPLMTKGIGLL